MLTGDERMRFIEHIYSITTPVKPHEAAVISSILGHKFGQHTWRVRSNHFCDGCRRELSVLDYFLTSLQIHSVDFINQSIFGDMTVDHKDAVEYQFEVRVESIRIDIARHVLDVQCMVCGTLNYGLPQSKGGDDGEGGGYARYFYAHPGPGGSNPPRQASVTQIMRIGDQSFTAVCKKLGIGTS